MKKQAYNPYLPSYEYIPDGEPYVFGDRVYIYGSHDKFNGSMFCMNNYVCWSAPVDNHGDWRCEGIIYDKMRDPMCDNPEERFLFAPDVQQGADGRYYLYYSFDFLGVIAVAVCDTPAGDYAFYGHVHYADGTNLGKKEGDPVQFDPGVLVDNDGKVYLYSGFCAPPEFFHEMGHKVPLTKGGMVIELETDMVTVKKRPQAIVPWVGNSKGTGFEGHEFFEAASMRKVGGRYYFIYSSINGHELCYAVSDKPNGGFTYGGTLISNGDIYLNGRTEAEALNYVGNNHGSIVEIGGQWCVFYHRQTNRHQFSRQACAEKIYIEADGSIKQVEMTSCGLNDGPLAGKGSYEARIACNLLSREGTKRYEHDEAMEDFHPYFTQDGADREHDSNQHIANMTEGAVAGYKYFDIQDVKEIAVKVRGTGKGMMVVSTEMHSKPVAQIHLDVNDTWEEFSAPVNITPGRTALYFTYRGEGYVDFIRFDLRTAK